MVRSPKPTSCPRTPESGQFPSGIIQELKRQRLIIAGDEMVPTPVGCGVEFNFPATEKLSARCTSRLRLGAVTGVSSPRNKYPLRRSNVELGPACHFGGTLIPHRSYTPAKCRLRW
jgi:hypothetical protein